MLPVGGLLLTGMLRGAAAGALSGPLLVVVYLGVLGVGSWLPAAGSSTPGPVSGLAGGAYLVVLGSIVAGIVGLCVGAVVGLAAVAGSIGAVFATDRWSPASSGLRLLSPRFGAASAFGGAAGGVAAAALILSQLHINDPTTWLLALGWVAAVSAWQSARALLPARTTAALAAVTSDGPPDAGTRSAAGLGRTIAGLGCIPLFVAVVMASVAALRVGWGGYSGPCTGSGYAYGNGAATGGAYNYYSGYFPPQISCVYEDGTVVELMSVQYLAVVAALALLAAGMLLVGLLRQLCSRPARGENVPHSIPDRTAAVTRQLVFVAALLLSLALATSHLLGLLVPAPPFDATADNIRGTTAEPFVSPQPDTVAPAPAPAPGVETEPAPLQRLSTAFTVTELTTRMQQLVDTSIQAAGPIDDPVIPAGTTFPVGQNDCTLSGETGVQLGLEVGFDTADDTAGLERVRALWAAEGYELFDNTTNAKGEELDPTTRVDARGTDILPAQSLTLRIYDDYLILNVSSLCVAAP